MRMQPILLLATSSSSNNFAFGTNVAALFRLFAPPPQASCGTSANHLKRDCTRGRDVLKLCAQYPAAKSRGQRGAQLDKTIGFENGAHGHELRLESIDPAPSYDNNLVCERATSAARLAAYVWETLLPPVAFL